MFILFQTSVKLESQHTVRTITQSKFTPHSYFQMYCIFCTVIPRALCTHFYHFYFPSPGYLATHKLSFMKTVGRVLLTSTSQHP